MTNIIPVQILAFTEADGSFIERELPVVIKDGARQWPAFNKWSVEFFKENYGAVEVPLSNYKKNPYQSAEAKTSTRIDEYLESALRISQGQSDPNEDLYSAGWFFCRGNCELLKDLNLPSYFQDNWADKVQKVLRFDTRSILFGHPKVESPLHTDSFFVSTYFGMIQGQKRMRLVHPKHTAHVHNGYDVFNDEKVAALAAKGVDVYDCTIGEGDLVWFPPGWWHHVKNDTFTISITTNFVAALHFLPFEQQVRATLLRPLLNLSKLKEECLQSNGESYSLENLEDSRFVELEDKFCNHFGQEIARTRQLLAKIKNDQLEKADASQPCHRLATAV
jgi:hypothetical protein